MIGKCKCSVLPFPDSFPKTIKAAKFAAFVNLEGLEPPTF